MKRDALILAMSTPDHRVTFDVGDSLFTLTLTEREFERLRKPFKAGAKIRMSIGGGAGLRRHDSKQEVQTPTELIAAVEERFGSIWVDLAADRTNKQASRYFGPGSPLGHDALAADLRWSDYIGEDETAWLNPPFAAIDPWAKRCAEERTRLVSGARIVLLVPASIGARWFREHVAPHALVLAIPRVTFVGHSHAFPKDLILALYSPDGVTGFETWDWRTA